MKELSLRFSRASKTYESWAIPQKYCADILLSLENLSTPLLDVGCGTGFASIYAKGSIGVDISIKMLKEYVSKGNKGVLGDAHNLPFKDKSFKTVISNFALHWTDLNLSIREIFRVCYGNFLCSIPVKGSLQELSFPFPSDEDVINIVESLRGKLKKVKKKRVEIPFSGWDLIRFFHYTGTSYNPSFGNVIISKSKMEKILSSINEPYFDVLFFSCEVRE